MNDLRVASALSATFDADGAEVKAQNPTATMASNKATSEPDLATANAEDHIIEALNARLRFLDTVQEDVDSTEVPTPSNPW